MAQTQERPAEGTRKSPVNIRKLGHVVFYVADVERSLKFYTEILNFRVDGSPIVQTSAGSDFMVDVLKSMGFDYAVATCGSNW